MSAEYSNPLCRKQLEKMHSPDQHILAIQQNALKLFSSYQSRNLLDEVYSYTDKSSLQSISYLLKAESLELGLPVSVHSTEFICQLIKREISQNSSDYPTWSVAETFQILNNEFALDRSKIHATINDFPQTVPLRLLYVFSNSGIVSVVRYLQHCIEAKTKASAIVRDLLAVVLGPRTLSDKKLISEFLGIFMQLAYSNNYPEYDAVPAGVQKALMKTATIMLDTITRKVWDSLQSNTESTIKLYGLIPALKPASLDLKTFQNSCIQQLSFLVSYKPDIKLSSAIVNQNQWTLLKAPANIINLIEELMAPLDCEQLVGEIDNVVTSSEINWKTLLTIVSAVNVFFLEGNRTLKNLVSSLLQKAFTKLQMDLAIAALLIIRQITADGEYSTSCYANWFSATFGGSSNPSAASENTFAFLVKVLSGIVPHETAAALKAHISNTPFIPQSERCRQLWRDYVSLSRTRLADLAPSSDEPSSTVHNTAETSLAEAEVESNISHFERTGHLPNTVLETAIFKRAYFTRTYLPALLKPRLLPQLPDGKFRFIEALRTSGKLSASAYEEYLRKCADYSESLIGGVLDEDVMDWTESDPLQKFRNTLIRIEDDWLLRNERPTNQILKELTASASELIPDSNRGIDPVDVTEGTRREIRVQDNASFQILQDYLKTLTKCTIPYGRNGPPPWARQYVLSLLDNPRLLRALYHEIWDKVNSFDIDDSLLETYGIILWALHCDRGLFPQVSTESWTDNFTSALLKNLPVRQSHSQEFFLKLLHAIIRSGFKASTMEHVPHSLVAKLYNWIGLRFRSSPAENNVKNYLNLLEHVELRSPEFQMSLEDFLHAEFHIDSTDDIFHWQERLAYLSNVLELNNFSDSLSQISFDQLPGDNLNLRILHSLLNLTANKSGKFQDCGQDILMVLQPRLLTHVTPETDDSPWLLRYWSALQRSGHALHRSGVLEDSLDRALWNLIRSLPPYLLSSNSPTGTPHFQLLNSLAENHWRNSVTSGAWLPQLVVSHVTRAVDISQSAPCLRFSAMIFKIPFHEPNLQWAKLKQAICGFNPRVEIHSTNGKISWNNPTDVNLIICQLIIIALYLNFLEKQSFEEVWYLRHLLEQIKINPVLINCLDLDNWNSDNLLPWRRILPDNYFKLLPLINLNFLVSLEGFTKLETGSAVRYLEVLLKSHKDWVDVISGNLRWDSGENVPGTDAVGHVFDFVTLGELTGKVKKILGSASPEILKILRENPGFATADEDLQNFVKNEI